jgi:sialic acid synthase SpsE
MENHYMVELDYFNPQVYESGSFEEVQNTIISYLSNSGKLVSLSMSDDEAVVWVVLKMNAEEEVIELMNSIPVGYVLSYEYYLLNHFEVIQEIGSFSLN